MKILHFAHSFFPVYGGTSTRLYNLLLDPTNEHFLYVPFPIDTYPNFALPFKDDNNYGNIKLRRFLSPKSVKFKIPKLKFVKKFLKIEFDSQFLLKIIEDKKIEFVHGHNPFTYGIVALKYAKKHNLPFLYEAHLFGSKKHHPNKNSLFKNQLYNIKKEFENFHEKKIYDNANGIIVQTKALKKRLMKIFNISPEKIYIIPVGVDEDKFNAQDWKEKGNNLRKEKNWSDEIIFMYSGYLHEYNGIKFLLESLKYLSDTIKDKIKIIIVGRGPLESYVMSYARKYSDLIEFHGLINYNEIPKYYSAIDVALSVRLNNIHVKDSVPQKLVELMAMEKLILASDADATKEVIKDNKEGILFRNGDKKDFLNKISFITENYNRLKNHGIIAKKSALRKYKWSDNRLKLQKIYDDLINKKR